MTSLANLDFDNLPYNRIQRLFVPYCPILEWNMFKIKYGAQQVTRETCIVTLSPHCSLQTCCHAMSNKSITDIMVTLFCFMRGNLSNGIFANIGFSVFQSGTAVTAEVVVMSGRSVAIFVIAMICSDVSH